MVSVRYLRKVSMWDLHGSDQSLQMFHEYHITMLSDGYLKRNCNTATISMMTFEAKVGWSGPVVVDLFCQSCFSNYDGWFFKNILATFRLQIFDKIVRFCTRSVTDSQEALQLTTKSLFNRFLQNAKLKPFWGTSREISYSLSYSKIALHHIFVNLSSMKWSVWWWS